MAEGTKAQRDRSRAGTSTGTTSAAHAGGTNGTSSATRAGQTTGTTPVPEADATTVAGTPIATTSDDTGTDADAAKPSARRGLGRNSGATDVSDSPGRLARSGKAVKKGSDIARSRIASLVWLLAVLAAIVLAVGALLVALDANRDNAIVAFVLDTARKIDGPFWRIFEFTKDAKGPGDRQVHDVTKEVLVNWGLAAVAYLIAGRILDRIIRP